MVVAGERSGNGFVLGKFMPPHAGHLLLCDTGMQKSVRLTILVCWLPDDPVPGPLRLEWMRALYPACRVVGHGEVVPQSPEEHPDFWPIWQAIVRRAHPEPIEKVFASEPYGWRLALELMAVFHPVDLGRIRIPLSASMVRRDPQRHWGHLPEPVRKWYSDQGVAGSL
jgi:HTH-type transcriptional repressor of NAD biosynthesis genes